MLPIRQQLRKLRNLLSYWTVWFGDQAVIARDGFLQKENRWFLVTTFKDQWALMESFLNFYRSIWKIDKFVLMMGYTEEACKQRIIERLGRLCATTPEPCEKVEHEVLPQIFENVVQYRFDSTEITICLVCYKTTRCTPTLVFDRKIRTRLHLIADAIIPPCYNRVLEIDNDEYLYAKSMHRIRRQSQHLFYFLDYLPSRHFQPNADMYWSLQGMLHRKGELYLKTGKIIHTSKVFSFIRRPGLSRHVHWFNLQRSCGSFYPLLPIRNVCSLTEKLVNAQRLNEAKQKLMYNGVCFHCPVLDLESIEHEKGIQFDQATGGYSTENFRRYARFRKDIPNIMDNFLRDWLHRQF